MNIIWIIFAILGILLLGFIAFVFMKMKEMSKPTTGAKIPLYDNPQKALLVIDIQEDYTGTYARKPIIFKGAKETIERVNAVIEAAEQKNMVISYVTHYFEDTAFFRLVTGNRAIKGQPGAQMDAKVKKVTPHLFTKEYSDSFSNPQLEIFLNQHQVNEIILVGLDAIHCIFNTAKGALNRGFRVTIISDCLLTRSKKSWENIFAMYQKEGITLLSSSEFAQLN